MALIAIDCFVSCRILLRFRTFTYITSCHTTVHVNVDMCSDLRTVDTRKSSLNFQDYKEINFTKQGEWWISLNFSVQITNHEVLVLEYRR